MRRTEIALRLSILAVQTSFARTLATGQSKGPMDYVKQGVDQLGQAAEKVKEAVSNAASTVAGAVSNDNTTSKRSLALARGRSTDFFGCRPKG